MPGLRRTRKRRRFRFDRNRKRVQKSQEAHKNSNIKVNCQVLKENWDGDKALKTNLESMGLAFDANKAMSSGQLSMKQKLLEKQLKEPSSSSSENSNSEDNSPKSRVICQLEDEAAEAQKAAYKRTFRFTSEQLKFITYMMDKYGDDYKAMSRDPKNHYQETPKQIRQKITKFISIPEQFTPFAKERGLLDNITVN